MLVRYIVHLPSAMGLWTSKCSAIVAGGNHVKWPAKKSEFTIFDFENLITRVINVLPRPLQKCQTTQNNEFSANLPHSGAQWPLLS